MALRSYVDVLTTLAIFAGAFIGGFKIAALAQWLFQAIVRNPNAGVEFAVAVLVLAFPSLLAAASAFLPTLSGKVVRAERSPEDIRKFKIGYGIQFVFFSLVYLGSFLLWPQPDRTTKAAVALIWLLWLWLFARPYVNWLSQREWRWWQPPPSGKQESRSTKESACSMAETAIK